MAGLNERLINEDAKYFEAETNVASVTSSAIRTGEGGQLGTKIILRANEDVALADTKVMTLNITTSDTEAGTFTGLVSSSVTASGATVYEAGAVIAEVNLPRTAKEWTKAVVSTDEVAPSGKFDVFCSSATGYSNV